MTSSADRSGDFGSKLRGARERKGVSLRQIANQTKISVAALEALERNDISRLPGGIFSRAFVRSYAVEVGLDPETTIQEFMAQFPQDSVTAGHSTSDPIDDNAALERGRRQATAILGALAIGIALVAVALYFSFARRGAPSVDRIDQAVGAPAPPVTPPSEPSPPTAPQPAVVQSVAPSSDNAPAKSVAVPAVVPAAAPDPAVLTVGLSARRPVWVSATVDGQKAIERLLQPGDQQTVEIKREMVLTAGDASALTLTLNGADARPLGRAGEVVTARFNLTNFKEYLLTR